MATKKEDNTVLALGIALGALYLYTQHKKIQAEAKEEAALLETPLKPIPMPAPPAATNTSANAVIYGKYHQAVKSLQAALHVVPDGVVGPKTLAAWNKYFPAITSAFKIHPTALNTYIDQIKKAGYRY